MKREILYTMKMPYRQDFLLEGFRFGEGEKSCASASAKAKNPAPLWAAYAATRYSKCIPVRGL